ncbi:MAG: aminotransferase class III-fold pyridoxal phosphate-dependent enzyme [Candidatus Hydrogenedentes bacterium]|nr:aminotransferase class III-fold pyridoxal phosphate-dependent enzyme [Candidatus Hydrogenedentota bacterium]
MTCTDDVDRAAQEALRPFLPERAFDAHAHLWRAADLDPAPEPLAAFAGGATLEVWREAVGGQIAPCRIEGGLLIPWPTAHGDLDAANAFVAGQAEADPRSRALALVSPQSSPERAAAAVEHPQVVGFKPYHVYAGRENTFQAALGEFLPEWAWALADERGLVMTVHLARDGALADPDNLAEIVRMCGRFPNARLVLAHAARGFHAPNTVNGLEALRGLDNVWFDTAAVCEPEALVAILRAFGPRRLLWGSDFCVSHQRGKCVTVGTGFAWIDPDFPEDAPGRPRCRTWAVGLEALRALQTAADLFGLNREDVDDIFLHNALRLLGLAGESGTRTADLYRHAKERIPGAVQLLSKRPELLAPDQAPAYFHEARGCEFWDLDGRHYYDMSSNGIAACVLGFRDPDVTRAVIRRVQLGSWCTLNPADEVGLADRLCALHPWAEQARFARTGGEIAAVAVRIARATTRRSHVAICGYHGWHDWYLAANLGATDALDGHLLPGLDTLGVPGELRGTNHPFTYNRRDEFQQILDAHGDRLAAVVMEPMRYHEPEPGFLEFVRDGAHRCGALLIFDEITIGWRLMYGGAHLKLGVNPDLALFAKSLGNGHPIAAVIGTRDAMEGAHGSFISSSYWTECVGPAAALAALEKMARIDVPAHVERVGSRVQEAWRRIAAAHGVPVDVDDGVACLAHFAFDHEQATELRTLFAQLMLERGFLAGCALSPTLAHTDAVLSLYETALDEVFGEIAKALANGSVGGLLKGPPAHSGFRRLL